MKVAAAAVLLIRGADILGDLGQVRRPSCRAIVGIESIVDGMPSPGGGFPVVTGSVVTDQAVDLVTVHRGRLAHVVLVLLKWL
jgi:hypothetical protein